MSFMLWTNEMREEGIDLGDPLLLLSSWKEFAGDRYPELMGVPLASEQQVRPEWLTKVRQQAKEAMQRYGSQLSAQTVIILRKLVGDEVTEQRILTTSTPLGDRALPFVVRRVNGEYIRDQSPGAEGFTNFEIHQRMPHLVPPGEMWVDDSVNPRELQFFIDNAVTQVQAHQLGKSVEESYELGVKKERAERKKTATLLNVMSPDRLGVINPRIRLLGEEQGKRIYSVRGDSIRDVWDTDFVEGGNGLVYPWIPRNEIWVEQGVHPHEIPFIVYHELVESAHMAQGDEYETAHAKASRSEWDLRRRVCGEDQAGTVHELRDLLTMGGER